MFFISNISKTLKIPNFCFYSIERIQFITISVFEFLYRFRFLNAFFGVILESESDYVKYHN